MFAIFDDLIYTNGEYEQCKLGTLAVQAYRYHLKYETISMFFLPLLYTENGESDGKTMYMRHIPVLLTYHYPCE